MPEKSAVILTFDKIKMKNGKINYIQKTFSTEGFVGRLTALLTG